MRLPILAGILLCLSVAYVAIAADSFIIYSNGTTTSPLTPIFQKAKDEGMGAKVIATKNNGSATASSTYTFQPSPQWVAVPITETAVSDANVATGVAYFFWSTATQTIQVKYRDATGTVHTKDL